MECSRCKSRDPVDGIYCDYCLVFLDFSYDERWREKENKRQITETNDFLLEIEFNYRTAAKESRQNILTKYGNYANIKV